MINKKIFLINFIFFLICFPFFYYIFTKIIFPPAPTVVKFNPPTSAPTTTPPPPEYPPEFNHGSRDQKGIALTFDADMTPYMIKELDKGLVKSWYNREIVDILRENKIPATIFFSGLWVETYPEIVKELAHDPLFEIGNHSYSHPRFTSSCFALPPIPSWGKEAEFSRSQSAIKKVTGITPRFFRFPGGCHIAADVKMANRYGLTVVGWDVASGDSFNTDTEAILNTLKTKTQNGSVILFHFHGNKNAPQTAEVLKNIIPFYQSKGFNFLPLSSLIVD